GSLLVAGVDRDAFPTYLTLALISAVILVVWAARVLPAGLSLYSLSLVAPAGLALALVPVLRSAAISGSDPEFLTAPQALAPELWGLPILAVMLGTAWLGARDRAGRAAPTHIVASSEAPRPITARIEPLLSRAL